MIALPIDVERLARLLAAKEGVAVETFIADLLEKRARAHDAAHDARGTAPSGEHRPNIMRLREIARRAASRPVRDDRTPEEIVDFDEFGVPR